MTQVTFDLVEFQQPIEDSIDHAQSALETQKEKHARHGIVAAGAALAMANLVIPRVGGNDLQKFNEYRRQAQALLISFWQDFGLVYLKRAATEEAVVRKVVHVTDNGQQAEKPPMKRGPYKKRGAKKGYGPEKRARVLELVATPPAGAVLDKWIKEISEAENVGYSTIYAWIGQEKSHK